MRVLAIIPARGGSKGVPGKNIKLLGGKPLIAHAIECAKKCDKVTKTIVSTDSDEILNIALNFGAEVIKRHASLAQDTSNVVTAVAEVYQKLEQKFDLIVLLQPTSPLRTSVDLANIITIFEKDEFIDGVISVVPLEDYHPARMYNLEKDNKLIPFVNEGESKRRQDLEPVYFRNGCFYAVRVKAFLKEKSFMVENKKAYVMDANWLVNIDSFRDFKIAEMLYEDWKNENSCN
ncbi:cytidylyltransferase domain-containing protein [Flavobacterium sp. MDT1-60]|uniref:acylneuraminate cytidylyltransferase family protein n=1 Tax=Flavobacterium sp. MDT1-60 TaxID=1979344 RepID=UPI001782F51D|nr:acylneuraminate cytidylyltransferase family protein [Flavobacterium sp. MDT1-60]QOG03819.1 acylneuraminate cytidylyltransferase family protein [Flavobacterium sp. MDT1-60]